MRDFVFGRFPALLAAAIGLSACAGGGGGAGERMSARALETGEPLRVACQSLPVHAAADGFSPRLGALRFGDNVTIAALAHTDEDGRDTDPPEAAPSWARVEGAGRRGFVSARCLADDALFLRQAEAERNAAEGGAFETAAGRGFGDDDEDAEFVASRGAFGAAGRGGVARFDMIDRAVDAPRPREAGDVSDFLSQGRLGEDIQ